MKMIDVYVTVIVNSDIDRSDITYVGRDKKEAIETLYTAYNSYLKEFDDRIDTDMNPVYADINEFEEAASAASAYIQCNDNHINFELHNMVIWW